MKTHAAWERLQPQTVDPGVDPGMDPGVDPGTDPGVNRSVL